MQKKSVWIQALKQLFSRVASLGLSVFYVGDLPAGCLVLTNQEGTDLFYTDRRYLELVGITN